MFGVYKSPDKKPMMITANPRHICQDRYIRANAPNTSYKYQKFAFNRNKYAIKDVVDNIEQKEKLKHLMIIQNHQHNDRESIKRIIRERVDIKMKEYEIEIDKRRKKLNSLLAKEEHEFIIDVVKHVQSFADQQFEEKKQKVIQAKAQIEKERLDFVKDMIQRQYTEKCIELRQLFSHQMRLETVAAQKIQSEENKQRKNFEKEFEYFWHQMQAKQNEAMKEAEDQKVLKQMQLRKETDYIIQHQLEKQKVLDQRRKEEKEKEIEEMDRLKEKIKQEEQAEKMRKIKLREQITHAWDEDVRKKKEELKQQTEEDLKICRVIGKFSEEELRKEQEKKRSKMSIAARDLQFFSDYNKEIEAERIKFEKERERIEIESMDEIKRKYDEQVMKESSAKLDLLKSCISTNEILVEAKHKERIRLKKKEDEENKFIKMTRDQSNKLIAEAARQKKLAIAKYRSDLDHQVRYAEVIKQRKKEEEKSIEKSAVEEEEKYAKIIAEVNDNFARLTKKHPFRRVYE